MGITRRNVVIGCGALALALPAEAQAGAVLSGRAFGGSWRVVLADGGRAEAAARETAAALEAIDAAMSPFRPDSELARFNRSAGTGWQEVSPAFAGVTAEALRIAGLSGGAFDPSIGPVVARYGFGPITGVRAGDYRGLAVRGEAIRKDEARLSLDLCGIAKGHALDAVRARLAGIGVGDVLIEIGGEVLARGTGPDGRGWRIGIADPVAGGVLARVSGEGLAFATSGDAINAYEVAGRRYSHIIDPRTSEPVRNAVASVTVAAPTGAMADALATALVVLGPERGLKLADALGVGAFFLLRTDGAAARSNPRFDALRIA
ncbi:FAD:protein FMN transferase [Bosea sp. (in: a-proteobacteria)]|uniref:FAD:protein FMN transferase n=1 Tax=Bosea sp. (in: a-proteobacteria) TaxID=1871050 RepID=UPI0026154EE3|nr:FAD:protein FMN transferase [Bosea sp. (in: a-proteobacteria)]MCO5093574.1 FAD:protein FMN transferase [Bosea sp. (in: a-proteobacteria)]